MPLYEFRCSPPNKSFHFSKNFFFKRIDKIQFFCYTIYVIKRTTGRPTCSWLPEETAVGNRSLWLDGVIGSTIASSNSQQVQILLPVLRKTNLCFRLVSRGRPIEHYVGG